MQQERVTEILDVIDDVLRENDLPLVLPEYRAEYEDSKKEGNEAFIYGDIYYELEDALKKIPSKEEHYKELLNNMINRMAIHEKISILIQDLLELGFTPEELEKDFNFNHDDIQDVLYELAEDAIEQ